MGNHIETKKLRRSIHMPYIEKQTTNSTDGGISRRCRLPEPSGSTSFKHRQLANLLHPRTKEGSWPQVHHYRGEPEELGPDLQKILTEQSVLGSRLRVIRQLIATNATWNKALLRPRLPNM